VILWERGPLGSEKAWAVKRLLLQPETADARCSYFIVAERRPRFPFSTRGGDVGFLPLANQDLILFSRRASVAKAAPIRAEVDALVSEDRLLPFGYYGWGDRVGHWQRA
jgi:hypothetical protein